jgi:hypothetical protein
VKPNFEPPAMSWRSCRVDVGDTGDEGRARGTGQIDCRSPRKAFSPAPPGRRLRRSTTAGGHHPAMKFRPRQLFQDVEVGQVPPVAARRVVEVRRQTKARPAP